MKSTNLVELIETQYLLTQIINHIPLMSIVGEQNYALAQLRVAHGKLAGVIISEQGEQHESISAT
jgi:hypothetical protein